MDNPLAGDLDHILEHTQAVWNELRGARILITGGTGFFGRWLLESLAWAQDRLGTGATAVVLSRDPESFRGRMPHLANHPALSFQRGDVRGFEFPDGHFDAVVHAATDSGEKFARVGPLEMFTTIVNGTHRALEFAVQAGATRFLLTSTGAVYGRQVREVSQVPETFSGGSDCADARNCYDEAKRAAEMLCSGYFAEYGLETKIARCFAFVGPYMPMDAHFAAGNFIRDGLRGGPIRVRGDGSAVRSYLYAADLSIWLWTILVRGRAGQAYNVGSENAVSIRELAEMVAGAFEPRPAVEVAGQPASGAHAVRYVPATGKARDELETQEWVGLSEGLRKTVEWSRRQPISSP